MRTWAERVLLALAATALVAALLTGYARLAVFDADQFANRATSVLEDEAVRDQIAERITDEAVLEAQPDLVAARPLMQSAASAIVGSRAFTGLFRAGVRDVHRAVFSRDRDTVTLTVADVGTLLYGALDAVRPEVAKKLRDDGRYEIVKERIGAVGGDLARTAERVRALAIWLFLLTALLYAAAIVLARDRRRAVAHAGVSAAAAGAFVIVGLALAEALAVDGIADPEARAAADAVWAAFLDDLRAAAWVVAGSGAVVAAAAASLLQPVGVERQLARAWRVVATEPQRRWLRALRALFLIAAGALLLARPDAVLRIAVTAGGVYLIYKGVEALLRLVVRPLDTASARDERRRVGRLLPRIAVGAGAFLLIGLAVVAWVGSGGASEAAPASVSTCNGHRELCDRRLNEMAFPATHNAMSVPLPGWFATMQEAPIRTQLDDGIRGLLIDTHYGIALPGGRVRTDLEDPENQERSKYVDGVGPRAFDAALRIRKRLGFSGEGERGLYLCHSFCELGATELAPVLDDLRDFLLANPGEVVIVVNQDAIRPADAVKAFEDAGLGPYLYRGRTSPPWPTLGQMVASGQRLVVLAENEAGGAPWYHPAYEAITQETPFDFSGPPALTDPGRLAASCEANRGPDSASVFLVNHWINTDPAPRPSNAKRVNAYEPLLRRARECARDRGLRPTLVAVDFYRRGDLFRVVDALNEIRP